MTIKVQQFHERGCLIHAHCRREVASLALGSRCLTRAVKSICHREAYLISVYRNPNAFPQVNGSFCRGPSVLRGKAKTQGRDQIELALLPSKGVTLGVREICRNPPPEDSLPKQPIASCKQKDHCPFLPQSCPPDMATPLGGGGGGVTSLMSLPWGIPSSLRKTQEKTWLVALTVFGKKIVKRV